MYNFQESGSVDERGNVLSAPLSLLEILSGQTEIDALQPERVICLITGNNDQASLRLLQYALLVVEADVRMAGFVAELIAESIGKGEKAWRDAADRVDQLEAKWEWLLTLLESAQHQ